MMTEGEFIGRQNTLDSISDAWSCKKYRIFGIYGAKCVGKSRLVQEFLKRKSTEDTFVKVVIVDISEVTNVNEYLDQVLYELELPNRTDCCDNNCKYVRSIEDLIKEKKDTKFIFYHDNQERASSKPSPDGELQSSLEKSLWDNIWSVVMEKMIMKHSNTYLFISSTDEFKFAKLRSVFYNIKVDPLDKEESLDVLRSICTWSQQDAATIEEIAKLCDGLPLALINAGLILQDRQTLSPLEILEMLLREKLVVISDESLPNSERMDSIFKERLDQIGTTHKKNLTKLVAVFRSSIRQTNNVTSQILEYDSVAAYKFKCLLPLLRRNLVAYDINRNEVQLCPMIQNIIEATKCLTPDVKAEIQCQINKMLENAGIKVKDTSDALGSKCDGKPKNRHTRVDVCQEKTPCENSDVCDSDLDKRGGNLHLQEICGNSVEHDERSLNRLSQSDTSLSNVFSFEKNIPCSHTSDYNNEMCDKTKDSIKKFENHMPHLTINVEDESERDDQISPVVYDTIPCNYPLKPTNSTSTFKDPVNNFVTDAINEGKSFSVEPEMKIPNMPVTFEPISDRDIRLCPYPSSHVNALPMSRDICPVVLHSDCQIHEVSRTNSSDDLKQFENKKENTCYGNASQSTPNNKTGISQYGITGTGPVKDPQGTKPCDHESNCAKYSDGHSMHCECRISSDKYSEIKSSHCEGPELTDKSKSLPFINSLPLNDNVVVERKYQSFHGIVDGVMESLNSLGHFS